VLKVGYMHPDHVKVVLRQIIMAMTHANKMGLMHRNLKTENVIFKSNKEGCFDIKLTDFLSDSKGTENIMGLPGNPVNMNLM